MKVVKITTGHKPGEYIVNGELRCMVKVPANHPFCHCCRKRVKIAIDVGKSTEGNPSKICRTCLRKRLEGLDAIENEIST